MMTVREVPAMRQIQAENRVARLQHRRIRRHVGLRSSVGLDIGMLGPKKLFGTITRQVLDNIGKLAATVIAFARIALGILIGEHRAHGFEHSVADEILGSNQLQTFVLTPGFVVNSSRDIWISYIQRAGYLVGHLFSHDFSSPPRLTWRSASAPVRHPHY